MPLACLDGEIRPAADTWIPATDEGLLRGDGIFEAIRLYAGRPFALDDHLARLGRSGAGLRLPVDLAAVADDVGRLLEAAGPVDAVLRIVLTRGGRRLSLIEPLPALPETMRLRSVTYAPTRVLDGIKSLSYAANMLTSRIAREAGFDEALLTTPHGRVLEGPTSSFFWVRQGALCTPPLEDHILASITRARVLALLEVSERPCTLEELRDADEAFLASTVREVMPVSAVDELALPAPGPVAVDARERFAAHVAAELAG